MPAWAADVIWWQVYPLGFVGAEAVADDRGVRHRLPQLGRWLDYLIELGANGLALGPVFAAQSHGYDTVDHYRVDSRLGDEDDFTALARAAHDRGIRVLLDGVFNHVGAGHPAFTRLPHEGPDAPTAGWFHLTWPRPWRPGLAPDAQVFEGHRQLVTLNHDNPAVVDLVVDVMCHWLDRGADGWRLDAAYATPPAFWAKVLPRVRERHPQAYIVGEVIHGDYAALAKATGMDSITQYELWKAIWSGINDGNLFELSWALTRHTEFLSSFAPLTFVGNHDVTRIASILRDERHLGHALAVLFTVGGAPSVYYGDEQGFRGVKEERLGGDNAIRAAFPDRPDQLPPDSPALRLHRELIGLRRRHRWLHRAATTPLVVANEHLLFASVGEGGRLLTALNIADTPARLRVDAVTAVLAGAGALRGNELQLAPHQWAVLG